MNPQVHKKVHSQALHALGSWSQYKPRLLALWSALYKAIQSVLGRWHRAAQPMLGRWYRALQTERTARALERPTRILVGALTGAVYGPVAATVLGVVGATTLGLLKGRPELAQLDVHLLSSVFAGASAVGVTLGLVALGIGAIVGATNGVLDGSGAAGLEWTLLAGLGSAIGVGIRYTDLKVMGLALVYGGIVGGTVGCLTWLSYTGRRTRPISLELGLGYLLATLLIAVYVATV